MLSRYYVMSMLAKRERVLCSLSTGEMLRGDSGGLVEGHGVEGRLPTPITRYLMCILVDQCGQQSEDDAEEEHGC
jgi:hypothetical protein